MVLDDFRCSPMISKTRKNIEITRLQRSSVSFNEPPYIILKASPKRKAGGSNPFTDGEASDTCDSGCRFCCVSEKCHPCKIRES